MYFVKMYAEKKIKKKKSFASRSLAPAEKNYSQLDKEGLAVCSEEVSPVSVWKTVFNFHRSQTTSGVVWTKTNTSYGFTTFTEMDTIVVRL